MANSWFRLWHDFTIDPKWRLIAEKSGQPLAVVIAIAVHLMSDASQNEESRGVTKSNEEVTAVTLGVTPAVTKAVTDAMQGLVIDGNKFINWDKRQPKREREEIQGSTAKTNAQRQAKFKARKRAENEVTKVTPSNARKRLDTESDKDSDYKIYNQSINHTSTTTARETKADLTGVLIEDSVKIEVKEKGEPQPASPPNPNQLIQQADRLIAEIFGKDRGRPTTHATDADTAQAWFDAGISPQECLDAIGRVCNVRLTRDEPAPRALSYFDKAVYAAGAKASSPSESTKKTPALVGEIDTLQPWVMELVRDNMVDFAWAQSWLEKCKLEGKNRIVCPTPFVASWLNGSGNHVIAAIEKKKGVNYRIEVAA